MRHAILLALLLAPMVARAAPLPLPLGARWLVAAPTAARFAREASGLLEKAGRQSASLSTHSMGLQLEKSFALPLTEETRLSAAGVELSQPWLFFGREGGSYLAVGVRDSSALAAYVENWATKRLPVREEEKIADPKGIAVTFSRSAGARPVAGYFIARGRMVLLVTPSDRSAGLAEAWKAVEEAAPVDAPVEGTVVAWLGKNIPVRDGWLGFSARPDGIDLTGMARKVDATWFARTPERADWIRALTNASDGLPGEAPARVRLSAGSGAAQSLVASFVSEETAPSLRQWIESLTTLGAGPVEASARSIEVSALQSGSTGDLRNDLLLLTRPQVQIVDRVASAVDRRWEAAGTALCKARKASANQWTSSCADTPLNVTRSRGTLSVSWGNATASTFEVPAPQRATEALSCAKGIPVASGRLDLAAAFRGTQNLGFLDALSNDALGGLYAFMTEYGALMKASRPAVALVCEDKDGSATLQGRWRFSAR